MQSCGQYNYSYLFVFPLCCSGDSVMTFVFIHHTQQANALAVTATVDFQQLVMFGADLLLHGRSDFHQRVPFESLRHIVGLQVSCTVRSQTHQAGLDSFQLPHSAEITLHIPRAQFILHSRPGGWFRP